MSIKGKLVVVETVYHQQIGEQPSSYNRNWSRDLATSEQPYRRQVRVGTDWRSLDCGWVEQVGMLLVENRAPQFRVIPTDAEKSQALAKMLELGLRIVDKGETVIKAFCRVPPGETARFLPLDQGDLMVRCTNDDCQMIVVAIPN